MPIAHSLNHPLTHSITVHNRQRAIKLALPPLQQFAERALTSLTNRGIRPRMPPQIDVILISDRRMSKLHQRFLRIAGPTDVITFQHGEICISVETARRQARAFGSTMMDEIQLYLVHGLLHLKGFDDKTKSGAARMRKVQERIARDARKS